jgi:two-component system sensor histidine kinase PilS (NtrC family)
MRISFETGKNFSTFLAARLVFATVLLGVAALFRAEHTSAWPYLILFAANTALSLGCWEWFRLHPPARLLRWFALTAAVILDTFVLGYSGGAGSEFIFLYFFSIGSAGLLTGLPGSLWTATLSSAGVVWLYRELSSAFMVEHSLRVLIWAVNFYLTAALTSYVFERLRERERAHQKTLGELEQVRLDTQAILDSLGTGVVVFNRTDEILYFNPASIAILNLEAGATSDDVAECFDESGAIGKTCRELQATVTETRRGEAELTLPSDGKPIEITLTPIRWSDEDVRGHIVLLNDLTHLKEKERAARERERLADIGRLSQDLAHEIRNPLATVRGCVEMIRLGESEDSESRPYLDLALRESDRLNGLLRDFLLFAHVQTPQKNSGNLRTLISARIRQAGVKTSVLDALTEDIPADFDSEQIALAVDAILLSLAEWGEGTGDIRVGPGSPARSVRFTLEKKSISPETMATAFRPFSDAHRISNGLALPTALRAIHAHGGKLTLNSEPGVGTWFELAI